MKLMTNTLVVMCALALGLSAQDDKAQKLKALLDTKASTVVTVRAVIHTEMNMMGQTQEDESRIEAEGVIVDPSGLVMMSNDHFNSDMGGMMGGQMEIDITVTPSDIKVVFGKEDKEYDATLVASDTKLNLAFVKIKDLGDRKPEVVSFDGEATAAVGTEVVMLGRKGKGFDYAPFFSLSRINGEIVKPRPAMMLLGGAPMGMPVFTVNGDVIGAVVEIESGAGADEGGGAAGGMGFLRRMMRGGGAPAGGGAFILPSKAIKAVIEQAKKKAGEVKAEEKKEEPKEEKKEEKKEEPKKDGN